MKLWQVLQRSVISVYLIIPYNHYINGIIQIRQDFIVNAL